MALCERPGGKTAQRQSRGKEQRLARHQRIWGARIRHNVPFRLARAGIETGKGKRCSHALQKAAPTHRIVPGRSEGREFVLHAGPQCLPVGEFVETAPELLVLPGRQGFTQCREAQRSVHRDRDLIGDRANNA